MTPRLAIAVVNYESGAGLRRLVDSLLASPPTAPFEVLVVDNASQDGSADFLSGLSDERVKVIRNRDNLGYTAAHRQAFAATAAPLHFLLNPDMTPAAGAIDRLVARLEADASLGAVAGSLVHPDGTPAPYSFAWPTPWVVYLARFHRRSVALRSRAFRHYVHRGVDWSSDRDAEQPCGGCLLVRRSLFPDGLMSRAFGNFWSDVEVARRIHLHGRRILHVAAARVTHDDRPRASPGGRYGPLFVDYAVGARRYFRLYGAPGDERRLVRMFNAHLLYLRARARLAGRHESAADITQAMACLRDDRNPFFSGATAQERTSA